MLVFINVSIELETGVPLCAGQHKFLSFLPSLVRVIYGCLVTLRHFVFLDESLALIRVLNMAFG